MVCYKYCCVRPTRVQTRNEMYDKHSKRWSFVYLHPIRHITSLTPETKLNYQMHLI